MSAKSEKFIIEKSEIEKVNGFALEIEKLVDSLIDKVALLLETTPAYKSGEVTFENQSIENQGQLESEVIQIVSQSN